MGKVVTREWRKAKSAELEFAFVPAFRDNSSFLGPLCLWQCLTILFHLKVALCRFRIFFLLIGFKPMYCNVKGEEQLSHNCQPTFIGRRSVGGR